MTLAKAFITGSVVKAPEKRFTQNDGEKETEPQESKPVAGSPTEQKISIEAVRAVLGPLSREGYTEQIRGILQNHGADKLSDIDPGEYAAILKEAEGLKNAAE